MRKIWVYSLLFAVITTAIFLFLWFFTGLDSFVKVKIEIEKLPQSKQEAIYKHFLNKNIPNVDSGVLAWINSSSKPGVWIWGSKGLRYLKVDQYSVYSYFSVCSPDTIEAFKNKETFEVSRNIYTDIKNWKEKAKIGQYLLVTIADENSGGNLGYMREAKAHDWFPFMPTDILKQCEKSQ